MYRWIIPKRAEPPESIGRAARGERIMNTEYFRYLQNNGANLSSIRGYNSVIAGLKYEETHPTFPNYKNSNKRLTELIITNKGRTLTIYYSYDEPIAYLALFQDGDETSTFGVAISENAWSNTTGRHINLIHADFSFQYNEREENDLFNVGLNDTIRDLIEV